MCCQVTVLISLLTWCNEWRHLCHGKIYEQRRWVGSNSWFILARSHTACIPHLILHKCPLNWIKPFKGVKITWKLIKRPSTVNNYFKLPSFYKIRQICASEIPLQAFHVKLGHTLIDGKIGNLDIILLMETICIWDPLTMQVKVEQKIR